MISLFNFSYTEVLVVLSMLFIFVMLVICCLQWKKNMEDEAEEEELFRINQMIAISEGIVFRLIK